MNKFPEPRTGRTGRIKETILAKDYHYIDRDLPRGMVVFEFLSETFGCITPNGVALSTEPNEYPFFEVPSNLVEFIN